MTGPWSRASTALAVAGLTLMALALGGRALVANAGDTFSHEAHAGLFPLCTGCHSGIATGDAAERFPTADDCAPCHDGVDVEVVDWAGPRDVPSNLRYSHTEHADAVAEATEPALACASCHGDLTAERPMVAVARPEAERCLGCHYDGAVDHYVDADCARCHEDVVSAGLLASAIAAIEPPADHADDGFIHPLHGELATSDVGRCTTCHVQEQCASCHVDVSVAAVIAELPRTPPELHMPVLEASYPTPSTHLATGFLEDHASDDRAECATCHTRQDCASCHVQPAPAVAASLLDVASVTAPGVGLVREAPASHATAFWGRVHGFEAAADGAVCAACHSEPEMCADCHDGGQGGGFHPARFVTAHAADAAIADAECTTCHSSQVFCRACHESVGMGSTGRLGRGFHDAEPLWLLRHGQPARQQLETCASCHQQTDCMQCHTAFGSFQVSPHRSGFDADAAQARSPGSCALCHLVDPLVGNQP